VLLGSKVIRRGLTELFHVLPLDDVPVCPGRDLGLLDALDDLVGLAVPLSVLDDHLDPILVRGGLETLGGTTATGRVHDIVIVLIDVGPLPAEPRRRHGR